MSRPCGEENAADVPVPSIHPAAPLTLPASVERAMPLTKARMRLPEEKNSVVAEIATMPAGDDMAGESASGPSTSTLVPFPANVENNPPAVGSCRMRAFTPSVTKSVFCAGSSAKPELKSPPHAPTPSANAVDAVPAIVETAQNVGAGTDAEGIAEDDAHEEVDALPVELSVGSAVVGPADGEEE